MLTKNDDFPRRGDHKGGHHGTRGFAVHWERSAALQAIGQAIDVKRFHESPISVHRHGRRWDWGTVSRVRTDEGFVEFDFDKDLVGPCACRLDDVTLRKLSKQSLFSLALY